MVQNIPDWLKKSYTNKLAVFSIELSKINEWKSS